MAIYPLPNANNNTQPNGGIELPIQNLDELNLSTDGGSVQETISEPSTPLTEKNTSPKINFRVESDGELPGRHAKSRYDSLVRREALLKGKEGSRRRQRWENDRLLGNPYAQPPLPSDWEVRPTHPVRTVPYFLAPLWDELSGRELSKNKASPRKRMLQERSRHEEEAAKVSKQVKEKLKRARSAKGLLQDLEEEIRQFVRNWEERQKRMEREGLVEPDSEDEEIVFVGRNGQMSDLRSPRLTEADLERNKLVFDSAVDDHAASFGRWLVHSIGVYYGLQTWSITVGDPARREAYVSIPRSKIRSGHTTSEISQLPRPLWGII